MFSQLQGMETEPLSCLPTSRTTHVKNADETKVLEVANEGRSLSEGEGVSPEEPVVQKGQPMIVEEQRTPRTIESRRPSTWRREKKVSRGRTRGPC